MIEVTRVTEAFELDAVYRLTHDAWVEEGLIEPQPSGRMVRHPELDSDRDTHVLVAKGPDGSVLGTNSITFDGPLGLPMDHGLKGQVDKIRATVQRLAGSWRIATVLDCRSRISVLSALIIKTIDIAEELNVDSCLFLFAKRHERVYQKLIGARTICSSPGFYPDAPLWTPVLMRVDREWFGNGYEGIRSLVRRSSQVTAPSLVLPDRVIGGDPIEPLDGNGR
jgi:hypothetical protein